MPQHHPLRQDRRARPAPSSCPDELFAAPVNAAVLHQAVDRPAGRSPARHARHEDARRGPRRRQEAVPPEGHRPRPPGLRRARRTTRAAASSSARIRASYEQRLPKRMKRLAPRGARSPPSSPTAPSRSSRTSPWTRSRPASWSATSPPSRPTAASSWSTPARDEKLELLGRATCPASSIILADSLNVVDVLNADTLLITRARAGDDVGGVRMTLQASAGHPAPGHQREVDGRDAAWQVHLRGPHRRQQAPDQGRRRGALQGHRAGRSTS